MCLLYMYNSTQKKSYFFSLFEERHQNEVVLAWKFNSWFSFYLFVQTCRVRFYCLFLYFSKNFILLDGFTRPLTLQFLKQRISCGVNYEKKGLHLYAFRCHKTDITSTDNNVITFVLYFSVDHHTSVHFCFIIEKSKWTFNTSMSCCTLLLSLSMARHCFEPFIR